MSEESFEKLQNRILSDAKLKAEEIISQAEQKSEEIIERKRTEAQKEAADLTAKSRVEAASLKRSILSSRKRSNNLKLLEEKNRIVQSVLSSAQERLSSIATSQQFQDTLKRFVTEAVSAVGVDQPIVRVGFNSAEPKNFVEVEKLIPKGGKLVVENGAVDDLGGVVASDAEGKVVYNNSFKARLDRLDAQLLAVISSTIFGE